MINFALSKNCRIMSKVNPKIDLVFKKIFGTDENKDLLKSLINSVLPENQKITTLTIKNPYNEIDFVGDRLSIVDIKATDEKEQWYNIEIQIREQGFFGRRSLFYWAELYSGQLFETDNFEKLHKTIMINLLDFVYFKDDRYVRRCCIKDFDTNVIYPQLDYEDIYFVELKKFDNELIHIKNTLDRWITFLNKASELDKDKLPQELNEPEIRKAVDTVERMGLTKKEREYYEGRKKVIRDDEGVIKFREEKAEEKGKIEEKLETAKNSIIAGLSNEIIKQITKLSDDQIDELRNKLNDRK